MILSLHPVFQLLCTLAALYAFYHGARRFRAAHLGARAAFAWKRHTRAGLVALIGWPLGLAGGLAVTWTYWHGLFITGAHWVVALAMLPFMLFGLASGLYMDRVKKRRRLLPLVHGLANTLALGLGLAQVLSGGWLYYHNVLLV